MKYGRAALIRTHIVRISQHPGVLLFERSINRAQYFSVADAFLRSKYARVYFIAV